MLLNMTCILEDASEADAALELAGVDPRRAITLRRRESATLVLDVVSRRGMRVPLRQLDRDGLITAFVNLALTVKKRPDGESLLTKVADLGTVGQPPSSADPTGLARISLAYADYSRLEPGRYLYEVTLTYPAAWTLPLAYQRYSVVPASPLVVEASLS